MDLLHDLGELALASRLRRLADRLQQDVTAVYADLGIPFEARWFATLQALRRRSPQSVTGLARELGLTHPAVTQIARALAARGLVAAARDARDERRRLLRLTPAGRALIRRLDPVWEQVRLANRELLAASGGDLLATLARVEAELGRRDMRERVLARLAASGDADAAGVRGNDRVAIVPYRPAYKKHFRALNEEWLRRWFSVEPADVALLDDPNGRIVRRGGAILFALLDGEVVGTCALVRHRGGALELAKMAVTERAQGRGIGRRLALAVIAEARRRGAASLFLETSPVLAAAVALYRSLGFRQVDVGPLGPSKYRRCTITMSLDLRPADAPPRTAPTKGTRP